MTAHFKRNEAISVLVILFMLVTGQLLQACGRDKEPESSEERALLSGTLTLPEPETYAELTQEEFRKSRARAEELETKTIGYVLEGRWGELLWCDGESSSSPKMIRVVRANDGLELVWRNAMGEIVTHGSVDEQGRYTVRARAEGALNTSRAPKVWDMREFEDKYAGTGNWLSVFPSMQKSLSTPKNAVAWLFVTRYGDLVCVPIDVKPVPDIIWVVKKKDGFDFVHSGPTNAGLYAQVGPDGRIVFHEPFVGSLNQDWSDATWMVLNENREPVFSDQIRVLPVRLEISEEVIVGADGGLSMRIPTVH